MGHIAHLILIQFSTIMFIKMEKNPTDTKE